MAELMVLEVRAEDAAAIVEEVLGATLLEDFLLTMIKSLHSFRREEKATLETKLSEFYPS